MVESFASHPSMPFHKWLEDLVAFHYGQIQMFLDVLARLLYNNQQLKSGSRLLGTEPKNSHQILTH